MATNLTDRAAKALQNKEVTDELKRIFEEFGADTINVHSDDIWADTIDPSPAQAVTDGTAEARTLFVLTLDPSVPDEKAWRADDSGALRDWISDKYGSNYGVRLFDNNDVEITVTDPLDWFFDHQTGILTISGNSLARARPYKVTGHRYVGAKGAKGAGGGGTVIRGFGGEPVEVGYRAPSGIGAPATSISSFPIQPTNLRQLRFGVHIDALGNPIIAGNNVVVTFNSGLGSPFVVTGIGTLDVRIDGTAEATMDNMIAGLSDVTLQTGSGDLVSAIIAVTKLSPTDVDATYIVNGAFPNAQFAFVDITAGLPLPSPSLYSGGVDIVTEIIQNVVVGRFAQEVDIGGHRLLLGGSQIDDFPNFGPISFPVGAVRSDGFQNPEVGFTLASGDPKAVDPSLCSFTDQVIPEFGFNGRGVIIEPPRDGNNGPTFEAVLSWTWNGVTYTQDVRRVGV